MLHIGFSISLMFSGNFSTEYAVLPPSNNVATIPKDATASATHFIRRTSAKMRFNRNNFLVPPRACRQNTPSRFLFNLFLINSKNANCSLLSSGMVS